MSEYSTHHNDICVVTHQHALYYRSPADISVNEQLNKGHKHSNKHFHGKAVLNKEARVC